MALALGVVGLERAGRLIAGNDVLAGLTEG